MPLQIRRAEDRGHANWGWLDTHHTFSFADYQDPRFMGFRSLRVINEDRVQAGRGFGTHGHRDMEILSYVLSGELTHRDSMGNGSVIRPGEVQRMSAGVGVTHSEQNGSSTDLVHFLQIWIVPARKGGPPGYEQRAFPEHERRGRWRLLASPDGAEGSVTVHQDARMYGTLLDAGVSASFTLSADRFGWVQVARGEVTLNGQALRAGDGAALVSVADVQVVGGSAGAEVLLFDLA